MDAVDMTDPAAAHRFIAGGGGGRSMYAGAGGHGGFHPVYRGESAHQGVVVLAGIALRVDWAAVSTLRSTFGAEWDIAVQKAFSTFDTRNMAKALACCSDISADEWLARSPPLTETATAFSRALNFAFHGTMPPSGVEHDAGDPRRATLWQMLLASGAKLGFVRKSSGG